MYTSNTPNSRRSSPTSMAEASSAAPTEVATPVAVHSSMVFHSTKWFLICEIRAAGAQKIKYSRLTPPAVYCSMPVNMVRYRISSEPPPMPKPLRTPVSRPASRPMIQVTAKTGP